MKEITGDMWVYLERKKFFILVTTNGYVKKNGECVMGRGNALEAAEKFPELPLLLGKSIKQRGNVVSLLTNQIMSFPVKNVWWEKADKKLIKQSVQQLETIAEKHPDWRFVLPRPGCGNGKVRYEDIRPLLKVLPDNVYVITKCHSNQ